MSDLIINAIAVAVIAAAVFISSCSSINQPGTSSIADFYTKLHSVTVSDLDAATARAVANGDQIGATCYPALKQYIGQGLPGIEKPAGVFDAFEMARLGVHNARGGIPDGLKLACAALVQDTAEFAIRMGAIAAGGAASAGALPVIIGPAVPLSTLPH